MIVQYLSEYITAVTGDGQKIAEFEKRYGYTPKPYLRDGLNDSRYYKLSNYYADEHSRYTAAVRLLAVVVHESKVAPPRGKQREVIRRRKTISYRIEVDSWGAFPSRWIACRMHKLLHGLERSITQSKPIWMSELVGDGLRLKLDL
jgi:hypothetical protein